MALRTPAFNDAKTYGFEWLRAMLEASLQEGVLGAGDLKVTAAAAGGQRVDVAAGVAFVKGDSGVAGTGLTQGLFMLVNDAAIANAVTLNASDATLPRLDQIVLRVRDSADLASGADDAVLEVITGVATAGATLDNRNGAAALGNDRIRLADVLVPAGSSAVSAGNVRDRRPWARGAFWSYKAASDYTIVSSTEANIDSTNLVPRLELSGGPVKIVAQIVGKTTTANALAAVRLIAGVNGAADSPTPLGSDSVFIPLPVSSQLYHNRAEWHIPAGGIVGTAALKFQMRSDGAATFTISGTAQRVSSFHIEELVRASSSN